MLFRSIRAQIDDMESYGGDPEEINDMEGLLEQIDEIQKSF